MTLFPPQDFRSTEQTHRQGLAANRPAAADVLVGTLYHSTDTNVVERSNGVAWVAFSGGGSPGPTGPAGSTGPIGLDGIDGEDGFIYPPAKDGTVGSPGATGATGLTGPQGPPGIDAEEIEYPYIIPGPKGDTGAAGGGNLAMSRLIASTNDTITAGYSVTIERSYTINSGIKTLVNLGSRLRIH